MYIHNDPQYYTYTTDWQWFNNVCKIIQTESKDRKFTVQYSQQEAIDMDMMAAQFQNSEYYNPETRNPFLTFSRIQAMRDKTWLPPPFLIE
jgi:hypothetical protein